MDGWVKVHRGIMDSKLWQNPNDLKIWLWMTLKASVKLRSLKLKIGKGCRTVVIERGEFIFGRNKASEELSLDPSLIYRAIQRFESEGLVSIESNNQYSIVKLLKFDEEQCNEDEEYFEIEEDRTTYEQPMNNQRTSNEQPTNSQRTTNEHKQEGLDSTEGKKSKEGEEGGIAPAKAAAPLNNLLPDENQNGEADPNPLSGAPPSPKKRKPPEHLHGRFLEIYDRWMKDSMGQPAKLGAAEGQAAKTLINHLRKMVNEQATRDRIIMDEPAVEEKILNGWSWFLGRYDHIEPFFQPNFLRLIDINSKFPILFNQAKNGTGKQQTNRNGSSAVRTAQAASDIIDQRASRRGGN